MFTVNWITKEIYIPKSYMTLVQTVPFEIYDLELNTFRLDLKTFEADVDGMPFDSTTKHNTEIVVSGVVIARVIEIINEYTITFEDGEYSVNLVGANSNVGDIINPNRVSVRSNNSAGLVSGKAIEQKVDQLQATMDSVEEKTCLILGLSQHNYRILNPVYDSNNLLTSSTIRVYPSALDTTNDTNHIAEYSMIADYDANCNLTNYMVTQDA